MLEPQTADLLARAASREAQYDWLGAMNLYAKAHSLISKEDYRSLAHTLEGISYAKYRAARQADTQERFTEGIRAAISSYRTVTGILSRLEGREFRPAALRCEAMIAHLASWLTPEPLEKRRLLGKSWNYALGAMNAFHRAGNSPEHWKTLSHLNLSNVLAGALEPKREARVTLARDGLEHSEEAIKTLSSGHDPNNVAAASVSAFFYIESLRDLTDSEEFEEYDRRAVAYWKRGQTLSERSALIEIAGFGRPSLDFEGHDKAIDAWTKALLYGRETRDHLIIGQILDNLSYLTGQKALSADNPDVGKLLLKESLRYAVESKRHYDLIQFMGHNPVWWVGAPEANHFLVIARYFATGGEETSVLLVKGLELCPEFLKLAEQSGYPEVIAFAHHVYGGILSLLARVQPSLEKKKLFFTQALAHREECSRLTDELLPFHYWNRGVSHFVTAEIRAFLADQLSGQARRGVLLEAIRESEEAARLCDRYVAFWAPRGRLYFFSTLGMIKQSIGDSFLRLFELTMERADLKKAVDAYLRAGEHYARLNISSRSAECHWKAGSGYEGLSEHLKAAEEFSHASEKYRDAADRFSPLKAFYQDYAVYMQAWSEIQKAKHCHRRGEYKLAKDHYETAATLHKSTQGWSYVESNYLAWARLDGAEDFGQLGKEQLCDRSLSRSWRPLQGHEDHSR